MLHPFIGRAPVVPDSCYVAPSADVIGDVVLGEESSVFFQAVIRGDVHRIRIGARTNVQDAAVLHVTNRTAPLVIGDDVTVGHGAILHGCTVRDRVLVGMGAVVMDHADVGEDTIIGARALVTQGTRIPPRSLVIGAPARVVRPLTDEEVASIKRNADGYVKYARVFRGVDAPAENPFYSATEADPTPTP